VSTLTSRNVRVIVLALALTAILVMGCAAQPGGELSFSGPDGELVNAAALADLRFEVAATDELTVDGLVILHGEEEANHIERADQRLAWIPDGLEDGEHTASVVRQVADGEPETLHTWTFTVKATPPEIEVSEPSSAVVAGQPVLVAGTTEPGATVSVGDAEATAGEDGSFEVEVPSAEAGALTVIATDIAGNSTDGELEILTVPSRVEVDEVRGLHVTQHAWAHPEMRERILSMAEDGKVNTVVLTLKDESGRIGYDSQVELGEASGATENVFPIHETVAELHERGIHVIGRIVAFRDPVLGMYGENNGNPDWLIRTPSGEPYTGRYPCCFMNFAHPEVREYNLEIAAEAAAAGVDAILWDYIRRPDGPIENLVIAGLEGTPEAAIVDFVAEADERLAPYGVQHGVSVYGIAATRPTQIAQDIPGMIPHVDIIAPMVYPSHWGPGEYDVADPNRQPYDIIYRSMEEFLEFTEGTRARVLPWLEDSNYRAWNRLEQVREQRRAAAERGVNEWMMWDPSVRYTVEAYDGVTE
jgi:hypothetical protein